jgi:2-polyprenyl-3-methyl-5-hydroxy-6-metoxy-1,4-benzoquinol methylase
MYTAFAQIYDELMGDVDYASWAKGYGEMMAAFSIKKGMVAECACGTGGLTIPLSRSGYKMTGIDISAEMLFEASKKARENGLIIPFVKQDMRRMSLHRPMDAVLCTCDGLNYLLAESDVKAFLGAAYNALRPGGGLFFDISTPYKLENTLGNNLLMQDGEKITYLWSNRFDKNTRLCQMDLCFFVKDEDGRYKRIDETQTQRAHSMAEITLWLEQSGFTHPMVYGEKGMSEPKENENRWHFAAIRD